MCLCSLYLCLCSLYMCLCSLYLCLCSLYPCTGCGQKIRTVFESRYLDNGKSQKLFTTLIGKLLISCITVYKSTIIFLQNMSAECETSAAMLKASCALIDKITQAGWRPTLKNHWSQEIWPPSSQDCNPFEYFLWSEVDEVEREVN